MGVVRHPLGNLALHIGNQADPIYLKPAKEEMQIGRVTCEAVTTVDKLDLAKPAKEEKEITRTDLMACKVALRSACLSKKRLPARQPWIELRD
jgi:hypothetical protein